MSKIATSNALWAKGVCSSMYGDNISWDAHHVNSISSAKSQASIVCRMLEREGFGGERKHFPLYTWIEEMKENPKGSHKPEIPLPLEHDSSDIELVMSIEKVKEMIEKADKITDLDCNLHLSTGEFYSRFRFKPSQLDQVTIPNKCKWIYVNYH